MIDFIEGKLAYTELDYIVVETGGIGYRIFCGNPFQFSQEDGPVRLYTHHYVREDAIHLYGFATREERTLFRMLLDVSGIGPKGALAVVSAARPSEIAAAVRQEDIHFLTRFPGIGKKTAQRIILDLKDKMAEFADQQDWESKADVGEDKPMPMQNEAVPQLTEAVEALKALGYQEREIETITGDLKAWIEQEEAGLQTTDRVVKKALQLLMKQ
ncbi:MAG: Holliday junction branch migration protein RuvA [Bacillaceae bacterium]|nr:Holliday junction branch migration protein RuvA [Bacillaceae bacterium]